MVVMLGSEQLHGLVDQRLVRGELLGLDGQLFFVVADGIDRDIGRELDPAIMRAGDQRRVHQDLVARDRIIRACRRVRRWTERSPDLPDVPTIAESGYPDYRVSVWYGIAVPAKLPDDVSQKISASLDRALNDNAFRGSLEKIGFPVFRPRSPAEIA